MAFSSIPSIEACDWYIDLAFRQAGKEAQKARSTARGNRFDKSKTIELTKIRTAQRVLDSHLLNIVKGFPSLDDLTEFYKELIKLQLDFGEVKKSCGAVQWARERLLQLVTKYERQLKRCEDMGNLNIIRNEFYGRICSVVKQIKKNLSYLQLSRRTLLHFPIVKGKHTTICIAGFPNVGKTTLLQKLTGAGAEINTYAFTTKRLNIGYNKKLQWIDTPGTLNRVEKMNVIEQQAYLAMKYCADLIVYVFDVTEPYPLSDQKKLLLSLEKFDVPILIYVSKHDVAQKKVEEFCSNTVNFYSVDELLTYIESLNLDE